MAILRYMDMVKRKVVIRNIIFRFNCGKARKEHYMITIQKQDLIISIDAITL